MEIEQRLQEAIDTGEVLRVTYAGGSQPGSERDIAPIQTGNGKVRARCYSSGAVKSFVIEKLALVGETEGPSWNPEDAGRPRYLTIEDAKQEHKQEWHDQGWSLEIGDHHLSFHQAGKRGKLLKTPTIDLTYEAETCDSVLNPETGDFEEHNPRPKTRPWSLRAKGFETRTFSHLDSTIKTLNKWAHQLAPHYNMTIV